MRSVYKNPKELATAVKDLVDMYNDNLMTYEKFENKISKISEANEERFFKNGNVEGGLARILGEDRLELINKIVSEK